MSETTQLLDIEHVPPALVVTPRQDLGQLTLEAFETAFTQITEKIEEHNPSAVILDFSKTKTWGSTVLGHIHRLHRFAEECGSQMIVCGLSDFERDVLKVTQLDTQWKITRTREAALDEVQAEE